MGEQARTDNRSILARAAVRGYFDPQSILGENGSREDLVFLAKRSTERQVGNRWLWILDLDSREEGLAALPRSRQELKHFLRENKPEPGDAVGEMFQRVLGARSRQAALQEVKSSGGLRMSSLGAEEQVRLFQVVATLLGSNPSAKAWLNDDVKRDIRRSAVLRDRADSLKTVLPGALRGRHNQRRFLLQFAVRGIDGQHFKGIDVAASPDRGSVPVVLVAGVGGIGKSALLVDVMRTLSNERRATTIAFDFDSPSLRKGDVLAMAMEFSRQLSLVEPEVEEDMSASRLDLRHVAESVTEVGSYEQVSSAMLGTYSRWKAALAGRDVLQRPLVLFLDTFEEVVVAHASRLEIIAEWARELVALGFSRVSLIISGRAVEDLMPEPGSALQIVATLKLGDLGPGAGRAKLRDMFKRHGIPHLGLVPALVGAFGSNPLVLEVLARFALGKNEAEIASLVDSRDAGMSGEGGFGADFAQRFLYSRILERLPDDETRKLARPGLVLRRVTPELITEVLAGPCGLGAIDRAGAVDLLGRMKRVAWLVQPGGLDEEALHRRDLRRIMLPLLMTDQSAGQILAKAVEWYSNLSEPEARLEALYYRGLARDDLDECSTDDLRALADLIGSDVDDLPLTLRARVKQSSAMKMSAEEIDALPTADRAVLYDEQAAMLVTEGLESAALSIGKEHDEVFFGSSVPPYLSAIAGDDAEVWKYHSSRSSDAQSRFNTRQFEDLSMHAAGLVRHLLRNLAEGGGRGGTKNDNLSHPAYLAALSTFHYGRARAQDEVREYLAQSGLRSDLAAAVQKGFARELNGRGDVVLAVLCVQALGISPFELPGFEQAAFSHRPRWTGSRSQAAWRMASLLGRCGLIDYIEPSMDMFPILSQSMANVLSAGADASGSIVYQGTNSTMSLGSGTLEPLRDLLSAPSWPRVGNLVPQAVVTSLKRVAAQSRLIFRYGSGGAALPEHFAIGLIPELRGPLRSELRSMSVDHLAELVDVLSSGPANWPIELTRAQAGDDLAKLVPPIVEAIDDSGQWGRVVPMLDRDKGTAAIIDGMRSLWVDSALQPGRS